MVHGGGSCSGGSSSGGGFTYIHVSASNRCRSNRRNRRGEDCTSNDCKRCFLSLGLCFGCRGQNNFVKIFKIWAWLLIMSFVTGLAVGFGRYGPTNIPVSPSDMMPITRGIHPSFCEGVKIESTLPVNTYLLPSPLVMSPNKIAHSITQTAVIVGDRYEYWGFYLLSGSVIEIDICGDNVGDLYIIQGDRNFHSWKENNYDPGTYKKTVRTKPCAQPRYAKTKLNYSVMVTDEFYIVLANHKRQPLSSSITFILNRTVYDLGRYIEFYNSSKQCTIDVSEDKAIVVYVPESDDFDFSIKTSCVRRTAVFLAIFLIIPLVIGVLVTGGIAYMICRANALKRDIHRREGHALISTPPAHEYQTLVNDLRNEPSAPSYNDVMGDPPSYDQAMTLQKN
ncbi:uncharacterized protein LOC132563318 [Ylistrum balloti]|uniref:uncharacterized protein LOC132563318 n=1 Tax=Ylistrum balloti TaxID=509963 RepID=UPI002905E47D|nr:uncharacterized protein LOC132563318 [Ylistrum balloti]